MPGFYVAAAEEAEARNDESPRDGPRSRLRPKPRGARRRRRRWDEGPRAPILNTSPCSNPRRVPAVSRTPGCHSPPGTTLTDSSSSSSSTCSSTRIPTCSGIRTRGSISNRLRLDAPAHHPRPHHHHQQQHWQQYPPQHLHHLHHTAITPQPQPATTPRKEGPKRVTPQGRRAPSGSGRRYTETAPPKPRVKFADTKEGRAVRELLGKSSAGAGGERYVNRVKSSTGSPTSLSLEEAKLLASLKRLDAHCLAVPVDNMRGSALDNGYHDSPYVDPGTGGRRSVEEAALMASLARLDTQLGGLGPPSERCENRGAQRESRSRRGVARRHRVMPHAAPRGVRDAADGALRGIPPEPAARAPVRAESRGSGGAGTPTGAGSSTSRRRCRRRRGGGGRPTARLGTW